MTIAELEPSVDSRQQLTQQVLTRFLLAKAIIQDEAEFIAWDTYNRRDYTWSPSRQEIDLGTGALVAFCMLPDNRYIKIGINDTYRVLSTNPDEDRQAIDYMGSFAIQGPAVHHLVVAARADPNFIWADEL